MQDANVILNQYNHDLTRRLYTRNMRRCVKFCRENYNVKTFAECKSYIQAYSDYLQSQNYAASTIHTYLASVCSVYEVDMASITKPVRHTADFCRGRKAKLCCSANDLENPKWAYIVEFQRKVGIRRDELMRLEGRDFGYDESGYPCVIVRRGKGGKMQYQRIADEDIAFVKSYFDKVRKNERIFDRKFFQNDLNLHYLRAACARRYYYTQLEKLTHDPRYREQLIKEIHARWTTMNYQKNGKAKPFNSRECFGVYILRGKNRKLAIEKGLPLCYDKTALISASIFKLSHWRNDVSIASYMLY